ncbi:MAG: hypothetical protein K2K53_02310, partial [Oscillospiraceae bacterium]|nr:hypothetical protein [Oscillospiraceae bacterium]
PIYWNGKVVWYVTDGSAPIFYTLDSNGVMPYAATVGTGITPPANTAYARFQTVLLDGKPVTFEAYALQDANGNLTNYVKARDVAWYLNGTNARFEVEWSAQQGISFHSGRSYTPNGSELSTPFSGDQPYGRPSGQTVVNGRSVELDAISLDNGSFTYYKLRDLGRALNFNVSYIDGTIVINTNEPYSDAQ